VSPAPDEVPPSGPPPGPSVPETLWWDYFGPRAKGTAEHFAIHVREFLAREKLDPWPVGVDVTPGHAACWCSTANPQADLIAGALRPRRRTPGAHEEKS